MRKSLAACGLALTVLAASVPAAGAAELQAERSAAGALIASFGPDYLVKTDGTYWDWGEKRPIPTQRVGLTGVDKAFHEADLYLKVDGTAWTWTTDPRTGAAQPVPVPLLGRIEDVFATRGLEVYALDADGKVYIIPRTLDENRRPRPDYAQAALLAGIDGVVRISTAYESKAGRDGTRMYYLKTDGTVWKDADVAGQFVQIPNLDGIVDIDANYALRSDGTVWTWPIPTWDAPEVAPDGGAVRMEEMSDIRTIASNEGRRAGAAVDEEGFVWFWGSTVTGSSDGTMLFEQPEPLRITTLRNVKAAFVIDRLLVALTEEGKLYSASIEREKMPTDPEFSLRASGISEFAVGDRHMILRKNDGLLWGWGFNRDFALGGGSAELYHFDAVPVQPPITLELNGEPVAVPNGGVITRDDQTFVPLRSIFERLGAEVTWDNQTKIATVDRAGEGKPPIRIAVDFRTGTLKLNGSPVALANPPFGVAGVSYLPLRFISEQLGATVRWEQRKQNVSISLR